MKKLPLFSSFFVIILLISAVPLIPIASAATSTTSGQAVDILQNNVYTYAELFSTGYTGSAKIPSGSGLIAYTADLSASSSSVAAIEILSPAGQILSTAEGTGYYVKDNFDFSFSGQSEYVMELFFSDTTPAPSNTIATSTNGVLAESSDGYQYAYSTNTQYSGKVFTFTQNVSFASLQATIDIFQLVSAPPPSDGTVHFSESGLSTGTSWSISYHAVLNGYTGSNSSLSSTTPYINLTMALGNTIYYWISVVNGITPTPSKGIINLDQENMTVNVVYPSPVVHSYSVTFAPVGIPSGTTWSVTLNGLTLYQTNLNGQDPDISFSELNGSYSFSVYVPSPDTASPSSGTVVVSGFPITENIQISQPVKDYSLTFSESGLSAGIDFTVSTNAGVNSGNPSISFTVPNGTYYYTIADIGSQIPSPASGSISINGANKAISITFSQATYTVQFTESGLSSGALWGVSFAGQDLTSSTTMDTFSNIVQGTYTYTATATGYNTITGSLSITSSSPSTIQAKVGFSSTMITTFPPTVTISSSQNYLINGTISPPSDYGQSYWNILTVGATSSNFSKTYTFSPVAWNFSIQVPSNGTYSLSFRLLGTNIESGYENTTATVTASSGLHIPAYYSISPPSGSVIYSSREITLYLKGNVTYSGILVYTSAYGQSPAIPMNSTILPNGTQALHFPLDISKFQDGQYNFKFSILYNNVVQTSLSAQYIINGILSITLKYSYSYAKEANGNYNVSFNVSVVDNSSISYSPLNILNVSLGQKEIGFFNGKGLTTNGITRDYFTFQLFNLSKGSYVLNLITYNKTGNVQYKMFSTNYTFLVPKLPPSTGGGISWATAQNWIQNNMEIVAVIAVVGLVAIIIYVASESSPKKLESAPENKLKKVEKK